ncbi:hypothetical protein ABVK25_009612 [Lepraria finkii]|uniref:Phytanoyl-CoA dioxygenase n=1 Tax=Lepraria finkii TaxID=1340010 RepID=A0ABR4AX27_9LECA
MMPTPVELDQDQVRFYANNGYVVLRNILSPPEIKELQNWAQEVHDLPRTPDVLWMPYEEVNSSGNRVLCRTENFANHHSGFNSLLRGPRILNLLEQLANEPMLLYKEKINYKLSGSEGFAPYRLNSLHSHKNSTALNHPPSPPCQPAV